LVYQIKEDEMDEHVARMGVKGNTYRVFVEKPKKDPTWKM
jgi:hypothetical protein